ncbi:hypothetical protein CWR43_28080 [Rhizobium sullae]|uniref:Uncharacterized protein n=1 Tax=Rhizobium sullae TaxID=50338 RepID=A0A2N0D2T4_RHISU|nr:hypothetical protein [Rhizobium sullae]PKA40440.1 hypothetical protein CWR43_28080 [Rhizobium sullae]
MSALKWRVVTHSRDNKFMVKGTELNNAVYGGLSRFQICEHRSYDADNNADRRYVIRDAETVTDADVRSGKRPDVVAGFDTLDAAMEFCDGFASMWQSEPELWNA